MTDAFEFAVVATQGWFDGERHHPAAATFLVAGGRIAEVSEGDHGVVLARRGIPVERGAFLLPGLVDVHVHLFLDGAPTDGAVRAAHMKKPQAELLDAARASARQSLGYGVCGVLDAGDRHGLNHRIRQEAAESRGELPWVRSAGSGLKRAQRYGAFIGTDVGEGEAVRQAVEERCASSDEIKIVLTGIIDFEAGAVTDEPQFTLAETELIVATARRFGRKTLAHCSGRKGLQIAARARVDSIEHGFFMDREILGLMRANDVAWTPTFSPVHFQWRVPEAVGWTARTVGNLRRILDAHAESLRQARALGVRILLGSDAGSMGVEHGKAVCEEIGLYREAGLPLEAALRAATATNREHLGLPDTLLRRGHRWEAVLLGASPFERLAALQQPVRVWMQ